jgi:hypothetical protein
MVSKVTFVNQNNKVQSFKVNLFGPARNRIKVANVLAVFKASVVVMGDGSIMEADDNGLKSKQQTSQVAGESPLVVPMRTWGINAGDMRSFASPNPSILKEKHKGTKRSSRGTGTSAAIIVSCWCRNSSYGSPTEHSNPAW